MYPRDGLWTATWLDGWWCFINHIDVLASIWSEEEEVSWCRSWRREVAEGVWFSWTLVEGMFHAAVDASIVGFLYLLRDFLLEVWTVLYQFVICADPQRWRVCCKEFTIKTVYSDQISRRERGIAACAGWLGTPAALVTVRLEGIHWREWSAGPVVEVTTRLSAPMDCSLWWEQLKGITRWIILLCCRRQLICIWTFLDE
jgi:hypothetical protein